MAAGYVSGVFRWLLGRLGAGVAVPAAPPEQTWVAPTLDRTWVAPALDRTWVAPDPE